MHYLDMLSGSCFAFAILAAIVVGVSLYRQRTKEGSKERINSGNPFYPQYPVNIRFTEMNRGQRRHYTRWLDKNNVWDGDVIAWYAFPELKEAS